MHVRTSGIFSIVHQQCPRKLNNCSQIFSSKPDISVPVFHMFSFFIIMGTTLGTWYLFNYNHLPLNSVQFSSQVVEVSLQPFKFHQYQKIN